MSCYVDADRTGKDKGEVYPDCCLDYGKPSDCSHAEDLVAEGLGRREDCKYWREESSRTCKCCGQPVLDVK